MAKPLKRPGATPAPAPAPTPAPAPVPAPEKPRAAPAPKSERKPKDKPAEESKVPKGKVEALVSEVEIEQAPSADATSQDLSPYLTALGRVEELRQQGKIGVQTREVGVGGVTRRSLYRPAVRPERVTPKVDRGPLFRLPPASMMLPNVRRQYDSPEMPTVEELANPEATARKMQEIVRDRDEFLRTRLANVRRVKELESMLRRAQQATAPGLPTSAAEADIHAGLKDLAARQRGLSERIAAKESTLREYGMTDEEIEPK